jgi:hypothetical protein
LHKVGVRVCEVKVVQREVKFRRQQKRLNDRKGQETWVRESSRQKDKNKEQNGQDQDQANKHPKQH